jgi:hypothetical protein
MGQSRLAGGTEIASADDPNRVQGNGEKGTIVPRVGMQLTRGVQSAQVLPGPDKHVSSLYRNTSSNAVFGTL